MIRPLLLSVLALAAVPLRAASDEILLPEFPQPPLVLDGGAPKNISSLRLLRELQRSGITGMDNFDTFDRDYALFQGQSLGTMAAWLESACRSLNFEISQARKQAYDGALFSRMLNMSASLASLRKGTIDMAMPIGGLHCRRETAWGALPGDGKDDVYVIFATDQGLLIYDPPTRQLARLADYPNKTQIIKIWF